ncbi:MAG: hypothetical protein HY814_08060 [Candidatus Riflebacteria bacterium]|nr:hypothetical protein [Candidatus Riflebacteria bacterium]
MEDKPATPIKVERRMLRERRFPAPLIPVLASMKVTPWPGGYCLVTLAPGDRLPVLPEGGRLLASASADQAVSFIVAETDWAPLEPTVQGALVERGFRVLRVAPIPRETEGPFMAVVGGMLADALVNAMPVWSPGLFDIVVKGTQLRATREALSLLSSRAKGRLRSG